MDIYFAGSRTDESDIWMFDNGYNRLLSYVNDRSTIKFWIEMKKQKKTTCKLFVDSGAFSMWTRGDVVNVDEYIDWLNERYEYLDLFGQVDVIPGVIHGVPTPQEVNEAAAKTWENYLYMRKRVKNKDALLYTFHVGEPIKYLKTALEYKDKNNEPIKYLALGGMVGRPVHIRKAFLDQCFSAIKKSSNPNVKVHTFGMTSQTLLKQYPITSADSTGWLMTAVNGYIYTKYGTIRVSNQQEQSITSKSNNSDIFKKGTMENTKLDTSSSINNLSKEEKLVLEQYVNKQGFTLEELQNSHTKRGEFNIKYFDQGMKDLVQEKIPKTPLKLF